MSVLENIEEKLRRALEPTELAIRNDSQKHAGHAGQTNAHSHLALRIVSAKFAGLPLVKRHKLVYAVLAEELKQQVHALEIDARAPDEAKT
ncbi:MAG: BolA family transcriptional regulator [Deltaproteobacteria bacterium]|nr:BolA family transcriptional regulator [Deltaproteobacteria bacterium]